MSAQPVATRTKILLIAAAAVQVAAIGAAHGDITKRDETEIEGSKSKWRAISSLTPAVGPLLYFLRGRR